MEKAAERFLAEAAATDVLVPIDTAPARLLGVVGVKDFEPAEPDQTVEGVERLAVAGVGDDVVAGRDQVARVEAHAHPRGAVQVIDDRRKMLEAIPEGPPLPGGVLEQDQRLASGARGEGLGEIGRASCRERVYGPV